MIEEGDNEGIELDDIEECSYNSDAFEVLPRQTRHGSSPNQLIENADRVRIVLRLLFDHVIDTDDLKSEHVNEKLYRIVDKHLKALIWPDNGDQAAYAMLYKNYRGKDSPPKVPEGQHDNEKASTYQDIVNFLFFQYDDSEYSQDHREACRQAFDGEEVDEYRQLSDVNSGEYLVLTDDEADEQARDQNKGILDEITDIPDNLREYFDLERFLDDCISQDGRGHTLASYDGEENEHDDLYIYRTN